MSLELENKEEVELEEKKVRWEELALVALLGYVIYKAKGKAKGKEGEEEAPKPEERAPGAKWAEISEVEIIGGESASPQKTIRAGDKVGIRFRFKNTGPVAYAPSFRLDVRGERGWPGFGPATWKEGPWAWFLEGKSGGTRTCVVFGPAVPETWREGDLLDLKLMLKFSVDKWVNRKIHYLGDYSSKIWEGPNVYKIVARVVAPSAGWFRVSDVTVA